MKYTGSKKNIAEIVKYIKDNWSYRLAEGKWAGGHNFYFLKTGKFEVKVGSYRVWSRNGKWSGLDARFHFTIPKGYDVKFVGGLLTFTKDKKAFWLEQGRGFDLKTINGFFYKGYHQKITKTINTFEKAVNHIKKRRSDAASRLWKARIAKKLPLEKVWVGFVDSIKSGNCKPGTDNFISNKKLSNIGGLRADYLLELENSIYTRRAIEEAKIRYA